jgi:hypothetical protein
VPSHPRRPNPKYTPWFNVPLKAARVSVAVINMLANESRASRLSFADVVKRLAEEPQDSGKFISKKVRHVCTVMTVQSEKVDGLGGSTSESGGCCKMHRWRDVLCNHCQLVLPSLELTLLHPLLHTPCGKSQHGRDLGVVAHTVSTPPAMPSPPALPTDMRSLAHSLTY